MDEGEGALWDLLPIFDGNKKSSVSFFIKQFGYVAKMIGIQEERWGIVLKSRLKDNALLWVNQKQALYKEINFEKISSALKMNFEPRLSEAEITKQLYNLEQTEAMTVRDLVLEIDNLVGKLVGQKDLPEDAKQISEILKMATLSNALKPKFRKEIGIKGCESFEEASKYAMRIEALENEENEARAETSEKRQAKFVNKQPKIKINNIYKESKETVQIKNIRNEETWLDRRENGQKRSDTWERREERKWSNFRDQNVNYREIFNPSNYMQSREGNINTIPKEICNIRQEKIEETEKVKMTISEIKESMPEAIVAKMKEPEIQKLDEIVPETVMAKNDFPKIQKLEIQALGSQNEGVQEIVTGEIQNEKQNPSQKENMMETPIAVAVEAKEKENEQPLAELIAIEVSDNAKKVKSKNKKRNAVCLIEKKNENIQAESKKKKQKQKEPHHDNPILVRIFSVQATELKEAKNRKSLNISETFRQKCKESKQKFHRKQENTKVNNRRTKEEKTVAKCPDRGRRHQRTKQFEVFDRGKKL